MSSIADPFTDLERKVDRYLKKIDDVRSGITDAVRSTKNAVINDVSRTEGLFQENDALKDQVDGLNARIVDLEHQIAMSDNSNKRLLEDYEDLRKRLQSANARVGELEDELREKNEFFSKLANFGNTVSPIKRPASPTAPLQSKRSRNSYGVSEPYHQDRYDNYDRRADSKSNRSLRDYSPTRDEGGRLSFDELRRTDDYSDHRNAEHKVSDYLDHLPAEDDGNGQYRDDSGIADVNTLSGKSHPPAEEISIRGKANTQVLVGPTDHSPTNLGATTYSPKQNLPHARISNDSGRLDRNHTSNFDVVDHEAHHTTKVWRRTSGFNGNGHKFLNHGGQAHDNAYNGAPQNYSHQSRPARGRRLVCHACWAARKKCDNRARCGNCSSDNVDCVRTICADFRDTGRCGRPGFDCFKVHDEQGYTAVEYNPFHRGEERKRLEKKKEQGRVAGEDITG
jgi:regulator of replication initiation timing